MMSIYMICKLHQQGEQFKRSYVTDPRFERTFLKNNAAKYTGEDVDELRIATVAFINRLSKAVKESEHSFEPHNWDDSDDGEIFDVWTS